MKTPLGSLYHPPLLSLVRHHLQRGKTRLMHLCCLVAKLCWTLSWHHGPQPTKLLCPWDSPGKNTGVGSHSLLQGIFLTQGLNRGLLYCRQILYCLSHKGSILRWLIISASFVAPYQFLKPRLKRSPDHCSYIYLARDSIVHGGKLSLDNMA